MTRYTLHIPEQYNDGRLVGPEVFTTVEDRILARAGGFTLTHGIGAWRDDDGTVYREPVRMYLIDGDESLREPLRDLADALALALEQVATYVTESPIAPTLVYAGVPA